MAEVYDFFLSYARADAGPELDRFYTDLCAEVRRRLGRPAAQACGFRDDRGIPLGAPEWAIEIGGALTTARAFVALYSPTYFTREACGKEWTIFGRRLAEFARRDGLSVPHPLIFPVLWVPLKARFSRLPKSLRDIQYTHAELGPRYAEKGVHELLFCLEEQDYRRFLKAFGEKLAQAIDDHPLPPAPGLERVDEVENAFAEITWEEGPAHRPRMSFEGRMEERRDDFLSRVERVVRLREEPVGLERLPGTGRFGDHLQVTVLQGEEPRKFPVGAVEWQLSGDTLAAFHQEVVGPYRWTDPGASALLVYGGEPAVEEIGRAADTWRIRLVRFRDYQKVIDFSAYREHQAVRLAGEIAYPTELYVPQRLRAELGQGAELEDALAAVRSWILDPDGRFVLVLGDFGTGKTFLLYELARRLAPEAEEGPEPILLQMRALEKGKSLDELLALHFARFPQVTLPKFRYLLEEGQVALLFDGFDELALRVTYPRAVEHFDTLLQAAHGRAKVVATSRKQHFLTDDQVRMALLDRVDTVPGRRIVELLPFTDDQIFQFLLHHSQGDEVRARRRQDLLRRVEDLMGLAHNPRLLGFIAELPEERLTEAARRGGTLRAADLYQVLIDQWLEGEERRMDDGKRSIPGLPATARFEIVTALALRLWEKTESFLSLGELQQEAARVAAGLRGLSLDSEVAAFQIGSGSLFQRDEEGRFWFLHQSILEWLVARKAAGEVSAGGEGRALNWREMSVLMTEFFCDLVGREAAVTWARANQYAAFSEAGSKNARQLLGWLGESLGERLFLAGQDLRGENFQGRNLDGADLSESNLEGVTLAGASLRGAMIRNARARFADLTGATLLGADLAGADLREARLCRADLRQASLRGTRLQRAKLIGARWEPSAIDSCWGAALAVPQRLECFTRHHGLSSKALAWSPDGTLIAIGSERGLLVLWEVAPVRPVRYFSGHKGRITCLAFSPDGRQLAGSMDRAVLLWEMSGGHEPRRFEGHGRNVFSVAFSPDGSLLASASGDGTVRLWETATGRETTRLEGHTDRVLSVAFQPTGEHLASGSSDGTIRLWRVAGGWEEIQFEGHSESVFCVAFSPDGRYLASASSDCTVCLWGVADGRELRRFEGHGGKVRSVAFSPSGEQLASGSDDGIVRLWEVESGWELQRFDGESWSASSLAFKPDGKYLAGCGESLQFWDVSSAREIFREVFREEARPRWGGAKFSPDGGHLVVGSANGAVLWEVSRGRENRRFKTSQGNIYGVGFCPDGKYLAGSSEYGEVILWEMSSGNEARRLRSGWGRVVELAFSANGKLLIGGSERAVHLWEVETGTTLWSVGTALMQCLAFSPDGKLIAGGTDDRTVRLLDGANGEEVRRLAGSQGRVSCVAFRPNGLHLAGGSDDRTVRIWEVSSGREMRCLECPAGLSAVAFDSGGGWLAGGGTDGTIHLWELSSVRGAARHFEAHGAPIQCLSFSPGGELLAGASDDGTIRLWEIATGQCLAILCPLPDGWAAYTPDGRYKVGGIPAGGFWHVIELCRFEVGELDDLVPGLRLPDDASFLDLPPWTARLAEPG